MSRRLFTRRLLKFGEINRFTLQNRPSLVFCCNTFTNDWNSNNFGHCHHLNVARCYSTDKPSICPKIPEEEKKDVEKKPSQFQRLKKMYRDYWYVLVPVHVVTSAAWLGGFYYLARSGVDIIGFLETLHFSETIINSLKDSKMGYVAISYALYKIATPLRYTVTLGGTTISINYLKKWGYIKPVPSAERLKKILHESKDNLIGTLQDTKEGFKHQTEKLKDKKDDIIDDLKHIKPNVLVKKKEKRD